MLFQNDPFRDFDSWLARSSRAGGVISPPLDAYRRNSDVWVHIDLPGVRPDSLDISVERNVLTVSGERSWQRQEGDKMYVNERSQGTYTRQVHLGDSLDSESIEADFHDGVLTLRIPIAEKAQPRKIAIKTDQPAIDVESTSA